MTKKDIEAIEHAKAIRNYCDCQSCKECVFYLMDENCILDLNSPNGWNVPTVKTYKQDFLEKFPKTDFDADCICRKYLYPDSEKYSDCDGCGTCENCWNEAYVKV